MVQAGLGLTYVVSIKGRTKSQGGGGTLIFSYIRRLGSFFGVQNLEFQYFLGFSEKLIFLGV